MQFTFSHRSHNFISTIQRKNLIETHGRPLPIISRDVIQLFEEPYVPPAINHYPLMSDQKNQHNILNPLDFPECLYTLLVVSDILMWKIPHGLNNAWSKRMLDILTVDWRPHHLQNNCDFIFKPLYV